MEIKVEALSPLEWSKIASDAHLVVFDELWDKDLEKISYALLMVDEHRVPISYATVKVIDKDSVYLQYGGAFPSYKGTVIVYKSFCAMLDFLKNHYKSVRTYVENINYPMLKFYMKNNFLITGIRYFKEFTLLEHCYEC